MKKKILISTSAFAEFDKQPLQLLVDKGYSYICNPYKRKLKSQEVIELGREVIGMVAGTEKLDEGIFKELEALKVVSRCGVGMDNVDLESAKIRGITVCNTPDGPTRAVAELTLGLTLDLLRKITQSDCNMRTGIWDKKMGNLLYGKKVGIIGFGRIGQMVAQLLSGFGVELAYCDIDDKKCTHGCVKKSLHELLEWADIISLHVSGSKDGPIIKAQELELMKKCAWLVNVSRGEVVDEEALYSALKDKRITGAAIDVFAQEPYGGKLKDLDEVILTPHIGSYAREARIEMEVQAVKNLISLIENA